MRKSQLAFLTAILVLGATHAQAQKTWDNGGGDGLWNTPANWNPDGVPGAIDDVVLDGTNLAGPYTVSLTGTAANARTVNIGALAGGVAATLTITGTTPAQLTIAGAAGVDDLVIDNGGRLENLSTAGSGNVITNTATLNTSRVKSGGYFLQNTARSFATPFPATGNGAITFDSGSTMEFGQATGAAAPVANRTYGNFILSATAAKTYTAAGASSFVVANDLTLGPNVTFNPTLTGTATITLRGNLVSNGSGGTFIAGGGILFDGTTTLSGSGTAITTTSDWTVASTRNLTIAKNFGLSATRTANISGNMTLNTGITLNCAGTMNCNTGSTVTLHSPVTGTGSFASNAGTRLVIDNAAGISASDATGAVQTTTRAFDTGPSANYTYLASGITGDGLPGGVGELIIADGASVELSLDTIANKLFVDGPNGELYVNDVSLTLGGQPDSQEGTLEIGSAGSLTMGTNTLTGTGTTNFRAGSSVTTAHPQGLVTAGANGAVQTDIRFFETGVNYGFNPSGTAAANANLGDAIVSPAASILIDNSQDSPFNVSELEEEVTAENIAILGGTLLVEGSLDIQQDLSFIDTGTTLQVASGGVLDLIGPVSGDGTFTLSDGGTLAIRHPEGITSSGATGAIQTGTRNYPSDATYEYLYDEPATAPQEFGDGLPITITNLTVQNNATGANGFTELGQETFVTGTLRMLAGNIRNNGNTLNVTLNAGLDWSAGYVDGKLARFVNATISGDRFFPVGSNGNLAPITFAPGSSTGFGTITASTNGSEHPFTPFGNANTLNRYWTLTQLGLTLDDAIVSFTYDDVDLDSMSETNLAGARFDTGVWTTYPNTTTFSLSAAANTGTFSSVDTFSDWTMFDFVAARVDDWASH